MSREPGHRRPLWIGLGLVLLTALFVGLRFEVTSDLSSFLPEGGDRVAMDDVPLPDYTEYFAALDPRFADVVDSRMSRDISSIGDKAGELTEEAAGWTGLQPGTAVAVANVDAHVSVPAVTVTEPGHMVMVMGTSTCHMVLGDKQANVEGMCGVVEDGILPGLFGYEAGQSGVGDIFAWFVDNAVPPEYYSEAKKRNVSIHVVLEEEAAKQKPGEHGLMALDWWNGNRSTLVDVELSGLLIGATLATTAPPVPAPPVAAPPVLAEPQGAPCA